MMAQEDKLDSSFEVSSFAIGNNSICSKLGWGKNYEELGLYQCINGVIRTRCFVKKTTGQWT
jgi:hypothetical protein